MRSRVFGGLDSFKQNKQKNRVTAVEIYAATRELIMEVENNYVNQLYGNEIHMLGSKLLKCLNVFEAIGPKY